MTTDFRAMCAELHAALEKHDLSLADDQLLDRSATALRAPLAQPEPEGPTKAELMQLFDDQSGYIGDEQVMWWSDFQAAARAVLARWGTSNLAQVRSSLVDHQPLVENDVDLYLEQ